LAFAILLLGCSPRTEIVLQYRLVGINLDELVRVETLISVDPTDGRHFFANDSYRSVAPGVGTEIRDFNGTGEIQMMVTEDATLGYRFAPSFIFTLLPPAGEKAPPLLFRAKAMAAGEPIGATDAVPGKFGPEASVTLTLTDQRCAGVACAADQACCSDVCTSVTTDLENCGGCGLVCAPGGDSCASSTCRCAGGSACAAGSDCCPGRGCVDFAGDAYNCGGCGKTCNPGETCSGGTCACGSGAGCAAGLLCCSGGVCAATCPCGSTVCSAPAVCCDPANSVCADLSSDSQNCGTCGHACTAPFTCVGGACACNGVVCAAGDACCSTGCRNLDDDPQNCGTCGNACGAGSTCVGGVCICGSVSCAAGQICCASTCVDPQTSSTNCGACGNACQRGESCSGAMCSCGPSHCVGNETCCSDGCFDLQNSSVHCGTSCDAPGCPAGFACMSGMCQQTTCIPACANGNTCVGTTCMCGSMPQCSSSQTCCTGACYDLQTDHDHCNSCTHACAMREQCVGGVCKKELGVSCNAAGECVSGHCSDGVCCNVDCTAACTYCALNATKGMCSPVPSGGDPHGLCVSNPSSACGTTGQCASGACAYWPAGTPCTGQSADKCYDAATLVAWRCNGGEKCQATPISCEPYKCLPSGGAAGPAVCASGPCAQGVTTMCTALLNNCAADARCCVPQLVNDCSLTRCAITCP
jgi:hypothetical protein